MPLPNDDSLNDARTLRPDASDDRRDAVNESLDSIPFVELVKQYELLERLGTGGMGTVTKARVRGLTRFVAIKRMLEGVRNQVESQLRFIEEAKAVARLHHPGIVRIESWGRDHDGPFLVLEFVDGEDLATRVHRNKGPLAPELVVDIACAVCDALQHAHEQKIIHRDIKPGNILISNKGEVKLTDFGLVRQIDSDLQLSRSGARLGTDAYMAPEQRDDARHADRRSDLWSLGATMYQLLTGRVPPVSMRFDFQLLPENLRGPVRQVLQLHSEERYQTAAEFADALRSLTQPQPLVAVPANSALEDGQCRRCRTVNSSDRSYCKTCGAGLHEPCLKCEAQIGVWERYCPKCGADLARLASQLCEQIEAARKSSEQLVQQQDHSAIVALLSQVKEQFRHPRFADKLKWTGPVADQVQQIRHDLEIARLESEIQKSIQEARVATLDESLNALRALEPDHPQLVEFDEELAKTVRDVHLNAKAVAEEQRDYAGAAAILEEVPKHLRIARLYDQVVQRRDRVIQLQEQIKTHRAQKDWNSLKSSAEALLKLQPKRADAEATLQQAASGLAVASRPAPLKAPFDARAAAASQESWAKFLGTGVELTNSLGMKLRVIPPGEFLMGSQDKEASGDESPPHSVRISSPVFAGVYPVTQAEYAAVMGYNPASFSASGIKDYEVKGQNTDRFPVEEVSWYDAVEFCNRLSDREKLPQCYELSDVKREGNRITSATVRLVNRSAAGGAPRGYRLPTEAEWEYFCRAGTTTPYWFGSELNGDKANVNGNYPYGTTTKGKYLERTTSVGSYAANPFGLYDDHGNVWEWCFDVFDGSLYGLRTTLAEDPVSEKGSEYRVLRGGSWNLESRYARSADRGRYLPGLRYNSFGFRVVR